MLSYICMPHHLHSSVDGHLGCFQVLAIVNSAAVNTGVHVSFQIRIFSRYIPRSGISRLYCNSIFRFLRKRHTVLHSDCFNLHFHLTVSKGSFFSTLSLAFIVCRLFDDGYWCFLWVWFQCVCPLMPSCNTYHLTWVFLTLGVGYLFTAAPAKRSRCSLPWTRGISSPPPFLTFNVG